VDTSKEKRADEKREDLSGQAAVKKIKAMVKDAPNCFFVTAVARGASSGARPMNVRKVDDDGNLWFLSAGDSHTNEELANNPSVRLFFQGSKHSDFLQLNGRAAISRDAAMIDELWEPVIKTWFTEGKDDPRITVIQVTPSEGYYWDTQHGTPVAAAKMLIGAAVGKTLDDSIQGKLDV